MFNNVSSLQTFINHLVSFMLDFTPTPAAALSSRPTSPCNSIAIDTISSVDVAQLQCSCNSVVNTEN